MDARIEAEHSVGEQVWVVAPKPVRPTLEPSARAHGMRGTAAPTEAEDRLSVDPLRETDRYRLVQPFTLPL